MKNLLCTCHFTHTHAHTQCTHTHNPAAKEGKELGQVTLPVQDGSVTEQAQAPLHGEPW